jgi:hypothetical protein
VSCHGFFPTGYKEFGSVQIRHCTSAINRMINTATGIGWIPYFGPGGEGIVTSQIMENQNIIMLRANLKCCGPVSRVLAFTG